MSAIFMDNGGADSSDASSMCAYRSTAAAREVGENCSATGLQGGGGGMGALPMVVGMGFDARLLGGTRPARGLEV